MDNCIHIGLGAVVGLELAAALDTDTPAAVVHTAVAVGSQAVADSHNYSVVQLVDNLDSAVNCTQDLVGT